MTIEDPYRSCAAFYDQDYTSLRRTQDVKYYVDLALRCQGPVLEMGCGTGRVLIPIARVGVEVHGIDLSEKMLNRLRGKLEGQPQEVRNRVKLTEGDIGSTLVGRSYRLIIAPFRVVQHLLSRARQRAWLRNVARQLAPGGRLAFDVFQPDFNFLVAPGGPTAEVDRVDLKTGRRIRRFVETFPRSEMQTIDLRFRWLEEDSEGREIHQEQTEFTIRWFTRAELENLLELEGFEIVHYWGSFQKQPFGEGSKEQIVEARLATPRE